MFDSAILNVFIGLIFIYLLYSLLATIIQEIIATYLSLRAETLKKGIRRMLDDDSNRDDFSKEFYKHPLIKYLGEDKKKSRPGEPAYLNANNFAKVIIDLLRGDNFQPGQSNNPYIQQALLEGKTLWKSGIEINPDTLSFLKSMWADAQGDAEKYSRLLEQWFDDTMERVSGWYKRKIQKLLLIIGFVIAVSFNVDSISIARKLLNNPTLAAQLADNAAISFQSIDHLRENMDTQDPVKNIFLSVDSANRLVKSNIKSTNELLGIGWIEASNKLVDEKKELKFNFKDNFYWYSIPGWVITALAISLGAPFWFDLLNKLMLLRTSKKEESDNKTEPSDIQPLTTTIHTTSEEAVG